MDGKKIGKALVAIGASAPTPILIPEAGKFLAGKAPTEENFRKAGEMAEQGVKPITDLRGSEGYRRDLAKVLTVRALESAYQRIKS